MFMLRRNVFRIKVEGNAGFELKKNYIFKASAKRICLKDRKVSKKS